MPDKRRPTRQPDGNSGAGRGVDAHGGPVIDPTENVIALVKAEKERNDDLRKQATYFTEKIDGLRATHAKEMRLLEAKRLDARRDIDQLAIISNAQQALAQIQTLATTTVTTAEVLRTSHANAMAAMTAQITNLNSAMGERVMALERQGAKGEGKEAIADPMVAENHRAIQALMAQQHLSTGKGQGMSALWALIGSAVLFIVGLITIGTFVFITSRQATPTIYTPAPAGTQLPTTPPAVVPR